MAEAYAQASNKCDYGLSESTIADHQHISLLPFWGLFHRHFSCKLMILFTFCRLIFIYQQATNSARTPLNISTTELSKHSAPVLHQTHLYCVVSTHTVHLSSIWHVRGTKWR